MGRTQPTKDEEFIFWALNLTARCTERQEEWGLNPASVQKLNELMRTAEEAYRNNLSPETRNHISVTFKKDGIAALRSFLSAFIPTLRSNEAIDESGLAALALPSRQRHNRQPLPPPAEEPQMQVTAIPGYGVRVSVRRPQHGHATASRTRKAYHGFVVRYRKEGSEEWHSEYSTRLHANLAFSDEDSGKRLALMAAWINPRLQHGPWSSEITVLIN
ncbi:MAG: hypothetical protein LBF19_01405 [Prevotellaceae bacterium]|jgi:hypothetical protein|nr:hypothetical protein [Prevotellaceae bacterium]